MSGRIYWLHGFLGCPDDFAAMERALTELSPGNWSTYCLKMPGHAGHPLPEARDELQAWLDDLRAQLPKSGAFVLGGYSLGARLAMQLAARDLPGLEALILLGGHPGIRETEERLMRQKWDDDWSLRFSQDSLTDTLSSWYRQELFSSLLEKRSLDELVELRGRQQPEHLALAMRVLGTGRMPEQWSWLEGNRKPTLYVAGGLDSRYVGIAEELSRMSESLDHRIVEGAGHALPLEAPRKLAALLLEWLEELDRNQKLDKGS